MPRISEVPVEDRPIEKILKGVSLTPAELLAAILGSGTRDQNVLELAQSILIRFGNLCGMFNATHRELCTIPGIKKVKAARLMAALQLAKIINHPQGPIELNTNEKMYQFIRPKLRFHYEEQLHLLFLNHSLYLDEWHLFSKGTHNEINIYLKDLMRFILKVGSPNLVLIHNHLEHTPVASIEDEKMTQVLKNQLEFFDIELLAHLVVGTNGYISLKL